MLVLLAAGLATWSLWPCGDAPMDVRSVIHTRLSDAQAPRAPNESTKGPDHITPAMRSTLPSVQVPQANAIGAGPSDVPGPAMQDFKLLAGGVEIVVQCGGEPLGCPLEVFTSASPAWPYPINHQGDDPPRARPGDNIDMTYALTIPELSRYVGSNGRCLIPSEGRVSVSLAVVVEGFAVKTLDRVALVPSGTARQRLVVELETAVTSVVGRVVDHSGKGVSSARVVWTAVEPIASWQVRSLPGALMRTGGDQLRANLEASASVNADGEFSLAPVLPSNTGVVRVFLGDLLCASKKGVHTTAGQRTALDPMLVSADRIVTVRLSVGGQWADQFKIQVTTDTFAGESQTSQGRSRFARSNHLGEVRIPVPAACTLTIRPMLDDQAGRFGLLHSPNLAFHKLLFAANLLAGRVLDAHAPFALQSSEVGDDLIIQITRAELDAACSDPTNSAALAKVGDSIAKSPTAPKDLIEAARAATNKKDLLPLMRKLFESRD